MLYLVSNSVGPVGLVASHRRNHERLFRSSRSNCFASRTLIGRMVIFPSERVGTAATIV
jgi:hypothetical protein